MTVLWSFQRGSARDTTLGRGEQRTQDTPHTTEYFQQASSNILLENFNNCFTFNIDMLATINCDLGGKDTCNFHYVHEFMCLAAEQNCCWNYYKLLNLLDIYFTYFLCDWNILLISDQIHTAPVQCNVRHWSKNFRQLRLPPVRISSCGFLVVVSCCDLLIDHFYGNFFSKLTKYWRSRIL